MQDVGTPIEEAICNVLKANWDHERTKFSLPPMMTLVSSIKCMHMMIVLNSVLIYTGIGKCTPAAFAYFQLNGRVALC